MGNNLVYWFIVKVFGSLFDLNEGYFEHGRRFGNLFFMNLNFFLKQANILKHFLSCFLTFF